MAQITIYLDDELLQQIKKTAKSAKLSQSQWITDLIRQQLSHSWPDDIKQLAGSWQEFPSAEEIRASQGTDIERECF